MTVRTPRLHYSQDEAVCVARLQEVFTSTYRGLDIPMNLQTHARGGINLMINLLAMIQYVVHVPTFLLLLSQGTKLFNVSCMFQLSVMWYLFALLETLFQFTVDIVPVSEAMTTIPVCVELTSGSPPSDVTLTLDPSPGSATGKSAHITANVVLHVCVPVT